MQNAARILALALGAAALTACNKAKQQDNNAMSIDENVAMGELPANPLEQSTAVE